MMSSSATLMNLRALPLLSAIKKFPLLGVTGMTISTAASIAFTASRNFFLPSSNSSDISPHHFTRPPWVGQDRPSSPAGASVDARSRPTGVRVDAAFAHGTHQTELARSEGLI